MFVLLFIQSTREMRVTWWNSKPFKLLHEQKLQPFRILQVLHAEVLVHGLPAFKNCENLNQKELCWFPEGPPLGKIVATYQQNVSFFFWMLGPIQTKLFLTSWDLTAIPETFQQLPAIPTRATLPRRVLTSAGFLFMDRTAAALKINKFAAAHTCTAAAVFWA